MMVLHAGAIVASAAISFCLIPKVELTSFAARKIFELILPDLPLLLVGFPAFISGALIGTFPKISLPFIGSIIPIITLAANVEIRDKKNAKAQSS